MEEQLRSAGQHDFMISITLLLALGALFVSTVFCLSANKYKKMQQTPSSYFIAASKGHPLFLPVLLPAGPQASYQLIIVWIPKPLSKRNILSSYHNTIKEGDRWIAIEEASFWQPPTIQKSFWKMNSVSIKCLPQAIKNFKGWIGSPNSLVTSATEINILRYFWPFAPF